MKRSNDDSASLKLKVQSNHAQKKKRFRESNMNHVQLWRTLFFCKEIVDLYELPEELAISFIRV